VTVTEAVITLALPIEVIAGFNLTSVAPGASVG
jgi:hypothetical protein